MTEQRKYQRLANHVEIKYQVIYSVGFGSQLKDGVGRTHSINLSEGGILFTSDILIPKDSFLEVELALPGFDYPIYLKGEVTHAVESDGAFEIGLKFEYKLENDSEMLHKYVLENSLPSDDE